MNSFLSPTVARCLDSRIFIRVGVAGLLIALSLSACASQGQRPNLLGGGGDALRSEVPGKNDLLTINSLAVARASVARDLTVDAAKVAQFSNLLLEQFAAESGIDVISEGGSDPKGAGSRADAILRAEITRFVEGTGSALGASKAALFAATFSIVRASDKKEIWSSNYFSTEHPESVNLIEVTQRIGREKRDGVPSTDSLATAAARGAALDFSKRRVEQFSRK